MNKKCIEPIPTIVLEDNKRVFCAIAKVTPVKKVTDVISVQFHRTKGISCTGEGIQENAEATAKHIRAIGGEAKIVPLKLGKHPVVYEKLKSKNPKAKTLIFYCMYDVVPVTPEEWTFPPFAAEIVNAEKVKLPAILYLFES